MSENKKTNETREKKKEKVKENKINFYFLSLLFTFSLIIAFNISIFFSDKNEKNLLFSGKPKTLKLNKKYVFKKIVDVSIKEMKQGNFNSMHNFNELFFIMENTLRILKKTCISMHHYSHEGVSRKIVGVLINNESDFITMINPKVIGKSKETIEIVCKGGEKIKKPKYVWIEFYHDLIYNKKKKKQKSGTYVIGLNKIKLQFKQQYDYFRNTLNPKEKYSLQDKQFHDKIGVCLQIIIDQFNNKSSSCF